MKIRNLALLLLLALPLPVSLSAQILVQGKIFTSPEQRQYLDKLRKDFLAKNQQKNFNIEESLIPEIPDNTPNTPAAVVEYSFDAIMTRADGRLTIWLNHQSLTEQQLPKGFRLVREGSTVALKVTANDGHALLLRPGQTIELNSGVIKEHSHKPAPAATVPAPKTTATTPESATESAATPAKPAANGTTEAKPVTSDATLQNQQSAVDSLPPDTLTDANKLDAMIKSLEALKKGLDENRKQ
jgi:hypothetical protein